MENTEEEEQQEGSAEIEEGSEAGWSDCEDRGNDQGDESESVSGESENGEGSGMSSDDSDGGSEKCAICLQKFQGQEIGTPETCEHHFCLKCITEWSKKVATCPVDRKVFPAILVKAEIFGTVQRIVDVEVGNAGEATLFDEYDTDPTYCEICGHCDREDRLLLCDGCDLGYHLECLEPPMEFVPIEDWYCPTCQTQRQTQTEDVVQRPSRRQIRLPRTGQSRRILESIRQSAWRETSSVTTTSGSSSTTVRKRRTYRRTGVRRTKGKKRGTGRKSKRRSRKGKQKRSRVVIERRPSTAKGRLAAQLGILPPRPGQVYVGLPRCRAPVSQSAQSSNSSALRNLRYQAGITPLRIYGTSEDLADCIESFSDEEGPIGVARPQSIHRIGIPVKPAFPYPGTTRFVEIPQQSSSPDILGPILNNQIIMLTDRNIQIKRDGTLIPSISISPSASPVKPTRRNSITNENSRRGYDPVVKSLGLKFNSVIKDVPPSSQPSLSMTNVTVRQAPSSPNSNDSTNGSTAGINSSNNNNGSSQGMSVGHEGRNSMNSDNAVNSWNSNTRGGTFCGQNSAQPSDDPNGARAYESFLHSSNNNSPKQNPDRKKSVENEPESKCDDDEEYNIYSDIEEDDTPRQPENEVESEPIVMKEKERDSDDDMVIDEDGVGMIKMTERESRSSAESSSRHDGRFESRQDPDISAISSEMGLKPEDIPSPTSIPLPDSPPPPTSDIINSSEDNDDDEEVLLVRTKRPNFSSPSANSVHADPPFRNSHIKKAREEYDPSQPLNSSEEEDDEEELEIQLPPSSPNRPKTSPRYQANVQTCSGSSSSLPTTRVDEPDLDLNSIPMPSDDYKRPTIQFSIPTRHKLLSISSLIKRQKGVAKKETKNALSFTSEISKAFGEDKQDDSDDEQNRGDDEPKLSLVAEIFGSDDEDDRPKKDETPFVSDVPSGLDPPLAAVSHDHDLTPPLPLQPSLELEDQLDSVVLTPSANPIENAPRWKKIVVETEESNKLVETIIQKDFASEMDVQEATANNIIENEDESSNDSISVLEMIENPKYVDDEVQVVSITSGGDIDKRSKDFGRKSQIIDRDKPIVLESISEGDSEFERDSSKGGSGSGSKRKSKKDKETTSRDKVREKDNRKGSKRKRSFSSVSNREEGEIIDSPEKRRKKKKEKKKSKKRRRSKDDKSTRLDFSEKKLSDVAAPLHNSSEEENLGDNLIAWRKPSNSAKERNYRDGKPKPEEKYFKPRDKKRDSSPRDRREKLIRDKSPPITKDKSFKERNDTGRSRRRSASPRSKSRSFSRSKNNRRPRSRSCRTSSTKSFHSRSRSRSLRRSHKRRFSLSPRRSRSGSRSPLRLRSRSSLRRSRNRKRSLSNNRTRRFKGRKRSGSSSGTSVSSKRSKRKRRDKVNNSSGEKVKKRREKEKEKIPEPRDVEDKEREKDKEKKKRKRRREKSVSPAKEIFADGDSIVVSLNFQKGGNTSFGSAASKDGGYTPPLRNTPDSEKKVGRGRSRRGRSDEKDENGKPRLLKKTLLIDLETSPIQEQNIGVSPTLIVLSDDEEAEDKHKGLEEGSKDTRDGVTVTTSSTDGQNEGGSPYRHGVAADSTQIHHPNQSDSKLDDSSFSVSMCTSISPYEGSNLSPTRGDSLVTSTRDSEMGLTHEDDSRSPSPLSPSLKSSDSKMMMHQPRSPVGSPPPPLPPGSPPEHLLHDSRNENAGTPTSSVSSHMSNHQASLPSAPGKPLIGNIPGLFPSSGVSASSNVNIPPPIVIPTPPNSQMRFPPAVNQNILPQNVLASVATALYAPILAARQQQQSNLSGKFSTPTGSMTVSGNKAGQQGSSVLLPKNQNSHSHGSGGGIRSSRVNSSGMLTGEGDSPFSPNSSEGDDLFEPPLERSQMDSGVGSKQDKAAGGQASNNSMPSGAAGGGNLGNTAGKPREKNNLFDNLFGGAPSKKPPIHHKSHDKPVKSKSAPHHKSKSKRVAKKEIPKLSEGELRLTEDVPTSAVELRVKEKFLKKLNRQERVVEEVKLSLKPHYSKKHVTKDEYKEILRRAVPKICHNKSGEINPFKIKELVEAYVKKFRHSRKKDVSSS
ncbi:unnamed protein product [Allacma fusca]|uniref:PHD and RING finger domain-containing protein 1 n=1 Tax=Allacma fusca TaxID=39272 RepID=A0A8J2PWJ3_9HEXA|nr:unnamed protein product [Allacma fusca]